MGEIEQFKAKTTQYLTNTGTPPSTARHVIDCLNVEGLLLGGIDEDDLLTNSPLYRAKQKIINETQNGKTDYDDYTTTDIVNALMVFSAAITAHISRETLNYCSTTPYAPRESDYTTKVRELISASNIVELEARRVYLEGKLDECEEIKAKSADFVSMIDAFANGSN